MPTLERRGTTSERRIGIEDRRIADRRVANLLSAEMPERRMCQRRTAIADRRLGPVERRLQAAAD